jgi:hypothetical protein
MRIYKTWVAFSGEPMSSALLVDTIEHAGKRWLVPAWFDRRDIGMSRPVRIICMDGFLQYTKGCHFSPEADYMLLPPLPRAVYEGRDRMELGGQAAVIEFPDLVIPNPALLQ